MTTINLIGDRSNWNRIDSSLVEKLTEKLKKKKETKIKKKAAGIEEKEEADEKKTDEEKQEEREANEKKQGLIYIPSLDLSVSEERIFREGLESANRKNFIQR